jgi:pimeloyl-ACP methyl ester carboxylesterase
MVSPSSFTSTRIDEIARQATVITTSAASSTCATSTWPATRWAAARSPATSAPTDRSASAGQSSSRAYRRTCSRRRTHRTAFPQEAFDEIAAALRADRFAYFTEWNKTFFNLDENLGTRISEEAVRDAWNTAVSASPVGTIACVATWYTDFRDDLPKIDVPVLVMHGTADRILPIEACGRPTHEAVKNSEYLAIGGASHGLCWTHAEEVNAALLEFLTKE